MFDRWLNFMYYFFVSINKIFWCRILAQYWHTSIFFPSSQFRSSCLREISCYVTTHTKVNPVAHAGYAIGLWAFAGSNTSKGTDDSQLCLLCCVSSGLRRTDKLFRV